MKKCPFCAEEIMPEAIKCKHCGSMLNNGNIQSAKENTTAYSGLFGAFLALVGIPMGLIGGISGNYVIAIIGLVMTVFGASIGAKHK